MSDRAKKEVTIRFEIKIEIDGENVQIYEDPVIRQQGCRCPKRQATQIDPRRIGGKDPAYLIRAGLLAPSYEDSISDCSD